ncbi:MAG: hypothetical protein V4667_03760 [Bacteroidota bacterium]
MKLRVKNSLLLLLICFCFTVNAQNIQEADKLFAGKMFNAARLAYQKLYDNDKNNTDVNYKIALCYFNMPGYKIQAKPYLEFVVKQSTFDKQALFYLAKIYQIEQNFDLAITTYNKFIAQASGKTGDRAYREIETCRNAIIAVRQPVDVVIENLGKDINSENDDFYPYVTGFESMLVFSTNRKGTTANIVTPDLQPNTDVFLCEVKSGKWQKAKNAGEQVNTMFNENCSFLSYNGELLINRVEKSFDDGDLCYAQIKNKKTKNQLFGVPINSASIEKSAYLKSDSTVMIFSSNRLGGYGGLDLWMSKRLPKGEWGVPTNLGPTINSRFNEDFPYSPDDLKIFFYSSDGFNSMGGFDIYKSTYDEVNNKWEAPKNIGYPINTPDDNYTISFAANKKTAYTSYAKAGGQGGLDIYKISYNQVENNKTLIRGRVVMPAGTKKDITETIVDVFTKKDQELFGTYKVQFNGNFFVIVPPGEYILNVDLDGFLPYSEEIEILDKVDFKENIDKTINLQKK